MVERGGPAMGGRGGGISTGGGFSGLGGRGAFGGRSLGVSSERGISRGPSMSRSGREASRGSAPVSGRRTGPGSGLAERSVGFQGSASPFASPARGEPASQMFKDWEWGGPTSQSPNDDDERERRRLAEIRRKLEDALRLV